MASCGRCGSRQPGTIGSTTALASGGRGFSPAAPGPAEENRKCLLGSLKPSQSRCDQDLPITTAPEAAWTPGRSASRRRQKVPLKPLVLEDGSAPSPVTTPAAPAGCLRSAAFHCESTARREPLTVALPDRGGRPFAAAGKSGHGWASAAPARRSTLGCRRWIRHRPLVMRRQAAAEFIPRNRTSIRDAAQRETLRLPGGAGANAFT